MKRKHAWTIAILFVLTIGGVLPLGSALEWWQRDSTESRVAIAEAPDVSWSALRTGEFTPAADRFLEDRSWLAQETVPFYRSWMWRGLKRTSPHVVMGSSGWLFLTDRVRAHSVGSYEAWRRDSVEEIVRVGEECRGRGVRLHVVLIPDRWRVAPDALYGKKAAVPAGQLANLESLAKELLGAGVPTTSLLPVLLRAENSGARVFYRDDHHWTSRGAEISMLALSRELRRRYRLPLGCLHSGVGHADACEEETATTRIDVNAPSPSSIWRKLGFSDAVGAGWRDPQPRVFFREDRDDRRGPSRGPSGGRAQIAYVSSSFGQWNSPEFLERALGLPVEGHVSVGRGSGYGMTAWLAEQEADELDTKLVVWEIPEYHLRPTSEPGLGATQ